MDFLGIGPWEILLILIIALIVLGPGRLPGIARTLGRTVRAIRKASADLTTGVIREMEATQNKTPQPQPKKEESEAKTKKAPSATDKATTPRQDDQPTKPGGASTAK